MSKSLKKYFFILLIVLTSFSIGFTANDFLGKSGIIGLKNIGEGSRDKIKEKADFGVFWQAWKLVEEKYKLEPLDYQKMVYGAVSGMVGSLGDPYTVFFSPLEIKMFEEDMKGSFGGIGAEIGFRDKFLTIISPLKDSPAEKAGLLTGDKIIKVDEKEILGMSLDEAVNLIRGEKGSKVKLVVSRDGLDKLKEIEVIRDIIVVKTIEWEMKSGGIAYISINQFKSDTSEEFDKVISKILLQNPRGIVLDLRNNPGGYLFTAVDVAGRFIDEGETVVIEDYGDRKNNIRAESGKRFNNIPVVVLVNEGSASASEILAGALRDINGSKLVGKKTFGKGLVQELNALEDGSSIKITIAKWLTPSGVDINKNGIEPDIIVDLTEEDYKAGRDPQLEKAMEMLK